MEYRTRLPGLIRGQMITLPNNTCQYTVRGMKVSDRQKAGKAQQICKAVTGIINA